MAAAQQSKVKLGAFVIASVLLFIGAVSLFGSGAMFRETFPIFSYFAETVQGLEVGSPVKLRGVPIGRVVGITNSAKSRAVRVEMEIDMELTPFKSKGELFAYLDSCVTNGLRCRLQYAGLTGMKYIELDYVRNTSADRMSMADHMTKDGYFLPSEPSLLTSVVDNMNDTLAKVAKVDFEGLSDRLTATLDQLNARLSDDRIERMLTNAETITTNLNSGSEKLNQRLDQLDVPALLAEVHGLSASMQDLLKHVDTHLDKADIPGTTASVRKSLDEIDQTVRRYRDVADTVTTTMNEMKLGETTAAARDTMGSADKALTQADATLKAVQEMTRVARDLEATTAALRQSLRQVNDLADTISEDPGAVLRGKRIPESKPAD